MIELACFFVGGTFVNVVCVLSSRNKLYATTLAYKNAVFFPRHCEPLSRHHLAEINGMFQKERSASGPLPRVVCFLGIVSVAVISQHRWYYKIAP